MKEYDYKDIKKISERGILFKDGYEILFEECRDEWANEKKIERKETFCVAKRDSLANIPYFLFYSKERVKVVFGKNTFFRRKRNMVNFHDIQRTIKKYGFSSFDMT